MKSVLILSGYFILWALIHTALASLRVKRWTEKRFGSSTRNYYRFLYVVFAAVSIMPLAVLVFVLPDRLFYAVPAPWNWLMRFGQAASAALLIWTVAQTDAFDFLGIRRMTGKMQSGETLLQEKGLYKISRHPMYLTGIFVIWLSPVMTANRLYIYICMTLYFILGSFHEEQLLTAHFGKEYVRYRKRVSRIVPFINRIPDLFNKHR